MSDHDVALPPMNGVGAGHSDTSSEVAEPKRDGVPQPPITAGDQRDLPVQGKQRIIRHIQPTGGHGRRRNAT